MKKIRHTYQLDANLSCTLSDCFTGKTADVCSLAFDSLRISLVIVLTDLRALEKSTPARRVALSVATVVFLFFLFRHLFLLLSPKSCSVLSRESMKALTGSRGV